MTKISCIMGIEGATNWESFNYLGVPTFKIKPKSTDENPMLEKIKKKNHGMGGGLVKPSK